MDTFANSVAPKPKKVGLFGGTFDPVHCGHIAMAAAAIDLVGLDELKLIPCHQPPHRERPQLSSEQRIDLLNLALDGSALMQVDDRELRRDGPSWTVDTLSSFRDEWGDDCSLVLLMGADAYSALTTWHQWERLPQLAHIGVFVRPGYSLPKEGILAQWLANSAAADPQICTAQAPFGSVFAIEQPPLAISATQIRHQLATGILPDTLPLAVRDYIAQQGLYGYSPR